MKMIGRDVPLLHDAVLCAHTPCLSCTMAQMEQQLGALSRQVETLTRSRALADLTLRVDGIDPLGRIPASTIAQLDEMTPAAEVAILRRLCVNLERRIAELSLRVEALEEREIGEDVFGHTERTGHSTYFKTAGADSSECNVCHAVVENVDAKRTV